MFQQSTQEVEKKFSTIDESVVVFDKYRSQGHK